MINDQHLHTRLNSISKQLQQSGTHIVGDGVLTKQYEYDSSVSDLEYYDVKIEENKDENKKEHFFIFCFKICDGKQESQI
jgi:hypothetical protein